MASNRERIERLSGQSLELRSFIDEMTERFRNKPDTALRTAWAGLVVPLEDRLLDLRIEVETIPVDYLDRLIRDSVECRLRAAEHSGATAQQLRLLAKDKNAKVKARVFENPNCPIDVLEGTVKRKSKPEIRRLATSHRDCPSAILEQLAGDSEAEVRASVARHHNTPAETLQRLVTDSDWLVRMNSVRNPALPASSLVDLGVDPVPHVNISLLTRNDCPDELVVPLAEALVDGERAHREAVAESPRCPTEVLRRLANDAEKRVRVRVAGNSNCPAGILEQLSADESPSVRIRAAENRACSDALRRRIQSGLADSKDYQAHLALAKSPACPPELLIRIAEVEKGYYEADYLAGEIRGEIACRTDAPRSALEALARDKEQDESCSIAGKLAGNPSCPPELRKALIARLEDTAVGQQELASNPYCPPKLLEKLSRSDLKPDDYDRSDPKLYDSVRLTVAQNPSCPAHILERLVDDPSLDVINAVMQHPACPAEVAARLAGSSRWYRGLALDSKACPEAVRRAVIADCFEPADELLTLEDLQRYGLPPLARSDCPGAQIRKAAKSKDWCERLCAALNQAASTQTLTALMDDDRPEVRVAAARTLREKSRT